MRSSIIIAGIVLVAGVLSFSWVISDRVMSKAASIQRTSLRNDKRWRIQLACRILLIAIAVIPLVILSTILLTAQFQTVTYSSLRTADNPALVNLAYCPVSNDVALTVTIRDLDTAQETADANLSLCVGDQVLKNLTVAGGGARPLSHGLSVSGLSASFLQSMFRVSYQGSIPETSLTRTVSIQSILEQADSSGTRGPVDLGVVSIPLFGNATDYPLDSYSATGLWVVSLPVNMVDATSSSIGDAWTGPTDVAATPDADNIAWYWGFAQGPGDIIEANRILTVKVFVLLISVLPLLLFIGLLSLLQSLIGETNRARFPAELLVAIGAFLLAIIPVRAVLVPSDISQTTVIDYILGTEMAVMVASSLMIVLAGSAKPASSVTAKPNIPPQETISIAMNSRTISNKPLKRRFTGAILLGLTGIAAISRIRQLLSRARKAN